LFVKPNKIIRLLYPSIIWKKETSNKKIWLTFDDGPDPESTSWILSVLKEQKIKATFFLVGEQIKRFPKIFNKIKKEGHVIGNHSFSHLNGWKTCVKKYITDVERCQKLMPNNNLFRPPYGKLTPMQIIRLKKRYKIILWDILTLDYKKDINSNQIKINTLKNIENGSIIVFHNNNQSAYKLKPILKEIIIQLKEEGYKFDTTW
jgi:peptidoglycan/xylan/chitin deacetylase (PgdA/CDA1 family)